MNQTKPYCVLLTIVTFSAIFFLSPITATAQQMDVAFGINTMTAPSASDASGNHLPQSLNGGAYPSFSGDAVLYKNFGVQGEFAWRASRGEYLNVQPYRPMFWDFNAMYLPRVAKHTYFELLAGLGSESTRYYQPFQICDFYTCRNYVTINHFMGHFGGGLRLYPIHSLFIRPEAHVYVVHDNQEFSSGHAVRYGMSIGYTFGGR